MKRLKALILIFCLALTAPMAYFVYQTHRSLEHEEREELRYFAETLFDEMERELELLVVREEGRPVDEYGNDDSAVNDNRDGQGVSNGSEPYILAYFQNNPDGSFQTPSMPELRNPDLDNDFFRAEVTSVNEVFNRKRENVSKNMPAKDNREKIEESVVAQMEPNSPPPKAKKEVQSRFAKRYLELPRSQEQKVYLGRDSKRVARVTADQLSNLKARPAPPPASAQPAESASPPPPAPVPAPTSSLSSAPSRSDKKMKTMERAKETEGYVKSDEVSGTVRQTHWKAGDSPVDQSDADENLIVEKRSFQVEVAPLQSVIIDDDRIFIYRRIMIDNRVFRQGFIIGVPRFLRHLTETYFVGQPMADFSRLSLQVLDQGRPTASIQAGKDVKREFFTLKRTFPRPFSFLQATLAGGHVPRSEGRKILYIMMVVLAGVILMGLLAIYQSARVVVDLSERRAGFVSSVTHELKTPLTNIRLYIEMLEQGIAKNRDREQEYFRILGSESARLSRLINNVLEFSKLEKRQRRLEMREGDFRDVLREVSDVMREKLRQEGYELELRLPRLRFRYDREVMIQILINLLENSMKFGKESPEKRITVQVREDEKWVSISVSDTGPGIPRNALKKIFDDFYRVDDSLTRRTKGTGIGLALVKKFVAAMGGEVTAANNDGPGCTITVSLPRGDLGQEEAG